MTTASTTPVATMAPALRPVPAGPSPLISIEDLKVGFRTAGRAHLTPAVLGVDLAVERGCTLGLVGESGSGKTITCLSVLRLLPDRARVVGGRIMFEGEDLLNVDNRRLREVRGDRIAMIFQDPMTSLNPIHTVGWQIAEVLSVHQGLSPRAAAAGARELLDRVGIPDPERRADSYPHQLSGGMNQRAMIALALACRPALLIADEPTTALDVTIQAQILQLLRELQAETGMAMILITHDLGVIAELADDVAVMYSGRVVEDAPAATLFAAPRHPYTKALLSSLPRLDDEREMLPAIPGHILTPDVPIAGCRYHPRCRRVLDVCRRLVPPVADGRPRVACFNPEPTDAS